MQTETTVPTSATCACNPSVLDRPGRHRLLLGGLALALLAAGFAWQWSWLVAIGVAPLLISTAPCLAMCALGLCMHRMGSRAGSVTQDAPTPRLTSENPALQQENSMSIGNKLSIVVLTAALGGLIVPAFAQNDSGGKQGAPDQGMSMGHMGQGMMHGGMMSRGMMGGGCTGMMRSMNNGGDGRPNSQWQKHPPGDATPD